MLACNGQHKFQLKHIKPHLGTMSFPYTIEVMKDLEYSTSGSVNSDPGGENA